MALNKDTQHDRLREYRLALEYVALRLTAADLVVKRVNDDRSNEDLCNCLAEALDALEIMASHCEVQEHPDLFFYSVYPERLMIDLRYTVKDGGNSPVEEAANRQYNKVKRALGLQEYHE